MSNYGWKATDLTDERMRFLRHVWDKRLLYKLNIIGFQVDQHMANVFDVTFNFSSKISQSNMIKLWSRYIVCAGKVGFLAKRSPLTSTEIIDFNLKFQERYGIEGKLNITNRNMLPFIGEVERDFFVTYPSEELIKSFQEKYMKEIRIKMDKQREKSLNIYAVRNSVKDMYEKFIETNNYEAVELLAKNFKEYIVEGWTDWTDKLSYDLDYESSNASNISKRNPGPGYRMYVVWQDPEGVDIRLYELYLGPMSNTDCYRRFEPVEAEDLEKPHEFRVLFDESGFDFRIEKKQWVLNKDIYQ